MKQLTALAAQKTAAVTAKDFDLFEALARTGFDSQYTPEDCVAQIVQSSIIINSLLAKRPLKPRMVIA